MDTGHQDLIAMIRCAKQRRVFIAPGVSEELAKAIIETWKEIGPSKVRILLDVDPEVCRMGYGQFTALQLLHEAAEAMGALGPSAGPACV